MITENKEELRTKLNNALEELEEAQDRLSTQLKVVEVLVDQNKSLKSKLKMHCINSD